MIIIVYSNCNEECHDREDENLKLRAAVGQYLGVENTNIDINRCQITSIDHTDEGTEVALVILPPKELPKILPCGLAKNKSGQWSVLSGQKFYLFWSL